MGHMIDGVWQIDDQLARIELGRFQRPASSFRDTITPVGEGFKAAAGRYHLYVSLACPWAHRTLIMRRLKGLESLISCSITHWEMLDQGWNFAAGPGVVADPIHHAHAMHEIYHHANPHYTGRVTVPVLWDRERATIVNNESAEILRMFNSAFDALGALHGDYYPEDLRSDIDSINERIYHTLNNGVYRCGFAVSQEAYDEAVTQLFDTLDWLEERLSRQRYLAGARLTEADIRAFPHRARRHRAGADDDDIKFRVGEALADCQKILRQKNLGALFPHRGHQQLRDRFVFEFDVGKGLLRPSPFDNADPYRVLRAGAHHAEQGKQGTENAT